MTAPPKRRINLETGDAAFTKASSRTRRQEWSSRPVSTPGAKRLNVFMLTQPDEAGSSESVFL